MVKNYIYSHPSTHNLSIISQNENNRFVTDVQISTWDDKQDSLGFTPENKDNKGVANGYASLNSNGLVPLSQLPASMKEARVVQTIAERDDIEDLFEGIHIFVTDASDDPTVDSGGAEYIWSDTEFIKISETESMDLIINWSDVADKPNSSTTNIDDAVDKRHSHSNLSILNDTTASFTTELSTKLSDISTEANKTENSSTNGNVMIDGVEVQVYRHPSTHTADQISDLDTAVKAIKVDNAINADVATNALKINGYKLFIQSSTPNSSDRENGTIWIDAEIN
ncbi:MAG: hypothetical protein ACOCP8_01830 [archaeon]